MNIGLIDIGNKNLDFSGEGWRLRAFDASLILKDILNNVEVYKQDVLIINTEMMVSTNKRTHLSGVDLIYWLRFGESSFEGLIIASGFLSVSQAIRLDSKSMILMAPWHHYIRGPLLAQDIIPVIKRYNSIGHYKQEEIKPYLKYVVNLSEIRHKEANWWGIKNLMDSYKEITGNGADYPDVVESELKKLNNYLAEIYYGVEVHRSDGGEIKKCKEEQEKLHQKASDSRVLLIDDQAIDGWADIYKRVIFGESRTDSFKVADIGKLDKPKLIIKEALKQIDEFDPHFVILDLRLIPAIDDKNAPNISEISGIKVLKALKEEYPGLPVLVSSASNKIWSYQKVISEGADAYWVKAGVDNLMTREKSLDDYIRLLKIINTFLNEEYQFLREMFNSKQDLFSKSKLWWHTIITEKWKYDRLIKAMEKDPSDWRRSKIKIFKKQKESDRNNILPVEIINDNKSVSYHFDEVIQLYRSFLSRKYFEDDIRRPWFYYTSMINHLFKTVELIHRIKKEHFRYFVGAQRIFSLRNDKGAEALSDLRNRSSHSAQSSTVGYKDFKEYFNQIVNYLNHGISTSKH